MTKRTCSVPGCSEPHNARGFCLLHYMRVMRTGDPDAARVERPDKCTIDGCEGAHKGYGLCGKHYSRLKKRGDPFATARGGPGYEAPHGTIGRYEYHACRCDPCTAAAREARHRWRCSPAAKRRHADLEKQRRGLYRDRVAAIKVAAGCADCGYSAHPAALDFDHVRGEKLFHIARGGGYPWETVEEEMAKCEVVCANCHRIRTVDRARGDDENRAA